MRYIFFILILSVVFTSCKKGDAQIENIRSSEYFPNSVGDYWKYKYSDSLSNSTSFVDVNIVGNKKLPNGQIAKVYIPIHLDH